RGRSSRRADRGERPGCAATSIDLFCRVIGSEEVVRGTAVGGEVVLNVQRVRSAGQSSDRKTEWNDVSFGVSRVAAVEDAALPVAGHVFMAGARSHAGAAQSDDNDEQYAEPAKARSCADHGNPFPAWRRSFAWDASYIAGGAVTVYGSLNQGAMLLHREQRGLRTY